MANRFWVGNTASWNSTPGTKWATTSGGAGGASVPTAADDVFLDAASGAVVVTLATAQPCRSLDCSGFTGTLTHNAAVTLSIGDATAGAGNVAFRLVAGMTYTLGNAATSALSFVSTSATQQTITTGGKVLANCTINGAGSSYLLADGLTATAGQVTLTAGALNTNNQAVTANTFQAIGVLAKTLTLGSSTVTLTNTGTAWNVATLTLNAGTSTISLSNAGTFTGGGLTYYVVTSVGVVGQTISGANTFTTLSLTAGSAKTYACFLGANQVVTGTLTIAGNSLVNRALIQSSAPGTTRTITAAAVSLTNVDFADITGAGVASPWTGTSMGDAQGNSGITFDAPVTQTHTASAGGSWSDATKWTTRVPLPQDDVVVDAVTTGTLSVDMPRLGKNLTFTGFAGTLSMAVSCAVYGNWTLSTGLTFVGGVAITLAGRGPHTITSSGRTLTSSFSLSAPGGAYTLQDALVSSAGTFSFTVGTFQSNDFPITVPNITANGATVTLGASVLTLTGTGTAWFTNAGVINAADATFVMATATGVARTFGGNGKVYGTLTYTVANSPGPLVITGANTFGTINIGSGRTVTLPSSAVTTVTNWNVAGAANGHVYLPGITGNNATAPDSAAVSVTGDLDVRVRVAMDTWTPAANSVLAAKWAVAPNLSWFFYVTAAGRLEMRWSADGTNTTGTITSSVSTGLSAGAVKWVRFTLNASNRVVAYYTSDDGSAWTMLGTASTAGAATSIADTTAAVEVGSIVSGTSALAAGKFYRAQIRNNILDDGTGIVFDANFATKAVGANTFVESSTNAATVTINGALARDGDGRVTINSSTAATAATLSKSSGNVSSDYLSISDSTATGGAAWFAGANSTNVSNNTGWFFTAPIATGTVVGQVSPAVGAVTGETAASGSGAGVATPAVASISATGATVGSITGTASTAVATVTVTVETAGTVSAQAPPATGSSVAVGSTSATVSGGVVGAVGAINGLVSTSGAGGGVVLAATASLGAVASSTASIIVAVSPATGSITALSRTVRVRVSSLSDGASDTHLSDQGPLCLAGDGLA